MLSYLLVYTVSLILIPTDIGRYAKQKVTGAVIKNTGIHWLVVPRLGTGL